MSGNGQRVHSVSFIHDRQQGIALLLAVGVLFTVATVASLFVDSNNRAMVEGTLAQKDFYRETEVQSNLALFLATLSAIDPAASHHTLHEGRASLQTVRVTPAPHMKVTGTVKDLSGLFPVNFLVSPRGEVDPRLAKIFQQFLAHPLFDLDENQQAVMFDSLLDCLDPDTEARPHGAENDYYVRASGHSPCSNGPLDHIFSLGRIRGFTEDSGWSADTRGVFLGMFNVDALDRTININTAPVPVLMSLADTITMDLARQMVLFRADPANRDALADLTWPTTLVGWPKGFSLDPEIATTRSTVFKARFTASDNTATTTLEAVVKKRAGKVAFLSSQVIY